MSDHPIPPYVDTRKVFQQDAEIRGEVALERLPRFRQSLVSDQGRILTTLLFSCSDNGLRLVSGDLQAQVKVQCQRCLEPFSMALADNFRLALVQTEAQAETLDADLDPWLCEDFKLDPALLVEEQLILCMPLVCYHPDDSCRQSLPYQAGTAADSALEAAAEDNPFAVLKSLKDSD